MATSPSNPSVSDLIERSPLVETVVLVDSLDITINNANCKPVAFDLKANGLYAYAYHGGAIYVYDPLNAFYTELCQSQNPIEVEDWR